MDSLGLLRSGRVLIALGSLVVAGCGDGGGGTPDAMPDTPMDGPPDGPPLPREAPENLKDTGLCANPGCTQFMPGIRTYVPRWQLWTDGATKQRWISLPAGTKIDTTDPDHWQFPTGAKLWKSFSLGGTRVETRYMEKLPPGDDRQWLFMAYAWNATQDDAVAVPSGREDANNTTHDIPSRSNCRSCHNRIGGRVLGFSALALDFAGETGELDLEDTAALGWLSTALPGNGSPRYPLPSNGSAAENTAGPAAVGYLHMNCGHCHNPDSPVFVDDTQLELRLTVGGLATWADTPIYKKAVGVVGKTFNGSTQIVKRGDAADSVMVKRMLEINSLADRMPQLGSVMVDNAGVASVSAWINALPAQ